MLIIGQNVEIWKVLSPQTIPTLCTFVITFLTVFIRRVVKDSWSLSTSCWSLMIRKYWISRFSFPSESVDTVSVSLPVLVMILNGRSHDFVDPRLLNLHLSPELPGSGSAELRKEVEQVVAAAWYAQMNVEVLAHTIFLLFWSDMRDSHLGTCA